MKICPLITQVAFLEDSEKELLVREADRYDLEDENVEPPLDENPGDHLFMNPDTDEASVESGEETNETANHPVRFIAKSYRGEVSCLGDQCRFHDGEHNSCRLELLMEQTAGGAYSPSEDLEKIKADLEKSWEFQQRSTDDILGLFRELEEKTRNLQETLPGSIESKIEELRSFFSSVSKENRVIIEAISDTLAEKSSELEDRIESSMTDFTNFKSEISDWKAILNKNVDALDAELEDNKKLVKNLTENHTEIVQIIENQKKSMDEEEKKQQLEKSKRLNNSGVMAYHNGQYEKALELFQDAIRLDPDFTEGYNNLGLTYTEVGHEENATDAFKKAIELNPDIPAAYNNLGYVFYRLGSYEEAIEMYNEAIGKSKDNSSAYTNLGNAFYKLDRIDDAIDAWKQALEIDPANEKARRNLKRFHAEVEKNG